MSLNYNVSMQLPRPSSSKSESAPIPSNLVVAKTLDAIDVQSLLAGRTEVRLVHRGEEYRLRITRQGKLLLTK